MAQATLERNSADGRGRPLTVRELAQRVRGAVEGDDCALIHGVSSIEEAEPGDIVFAENSRFLSQAEKSQASAIIAFLDATTPDKPLIKVDNPRFAFAEILQLFAPRFHVTPGIHRTAVVSRTAIVAEGASVGANAVVGERVEIGVDSVIFPGCYVGDDCVIAEGCVIHPNVTLYHGTVLGNRVIIHSGTVIGADGFGYMPLGDRAVKVPQIGIVEIGDDVEIGANCTVDRSKTGVTTIGARTKIDNLVHIAHNVKIGTDCIIVAQAGIAGSVVIEQGAKIAGQAGLKDHITIGAGAVVMAQAGLFGSVKPGEVVSGYPARPHREKLRQDAAAASLPEYIKRIRALEKANVELLEQNARLERTLNALAARLGVKLEEG